MPLSESDIYVPGQDDGVDSQSQRSQDEIAAEILSRQAAEYQRTAALNDGNGPSPTDDPFGDDSDDQLDQYNDPFFSSQLQPTPVFTGYAGFPASASSTLISSSSAPPSQSQAPPTSSVVPVSSTSATTSATLGAVSPGPEVTTSTGRSGASSAAIGVTVTIIVLLVAIAGFFLVRKKYQDKRKKRRATWTAPGIINTSHNGNVSPGPRSPEIQDMEHGEGKNQYGGHQDVFEEIDINEKRGPSPLPDEITYQTVQVPPFKMPTPPPALHPTGFAPPRLPSPPPVTITSPDGIGSPLPIGYNAASIGSAEAPLVSATPFAAVPIPRSSVASSSVGSAMGAQISTGTLVIVARTFVPSLPDELSIQTGEQVRVLQRFDDGWAHVERLKGGAGVENGVVPTECLEEVYGSGGGVGAVPVLPPVPGMGLTQEAVEAWRLSKRKSSLNPAGPAHY